MLFYERLPPQVFIPQYLNDVSPTVMPRLRKPNEDEAEEAPIIGGK